jgi:hypothetical protein
MEIVAASLLAVNRESRPQIIPIIVQPNRPFTIGRTNFTSRDDTIISRRHAQFHIATQRGPEALFVTNLSLVSGVLVNFTPLRHLDMRELFHGDEVVRSSTCGGLTVVFLRDT